MDLNQAIQLAARYANQGKFEEADKVCRDMIAFNDRFHPAFHLLGQMASHVGRNDVAIPMLQRAAALDPGRASYHRDLAEAMIFGAKPQDAIPVLNQAIKIDANDPKAHFFLGLATMSVGRLDDAMKAYQTAIKLEPNYGPAYNNIGSLYEGRGDLKEARNAYKKAIKIDPKNVQAQNNIAAILIAEGEIDAAKDHLEEAINARPDFIEAHHNLSALKKYQQDDPHLDILKSLLANIDKMPVDYQVRLHFILGKVKADLGDYDLSFDHYQKGNALKRGTFEYDEEAFKKHTDAIKSQFTAEYIESGQPCEDIGITPIFIVGMPRSGSSLIEQILSSHSEIEAGGELTYLSDLVRDHIGVFPTNLTDEKLANIGNEYLLKIKEINVQARFIVDKMPGNFQYAGLIAKIFPDAKIIHSKRNVMDCCVSNYTHLFLHTIHFTNDLGELGRYFNILSDLMDHWHTVLPGDLLYDIQYEDVVENLEIEAKKLVDFIGVDWKEDCLSFHEKKGAVKTASAAQVRKPIYKSSVERWRDYEKFLGPLKEVLEKN